MWGLWWGKVAKTLIAWWLVRLTKKVQRGRFKRVARVTKSANTFSTMASDHSASAANVHSFSNAPQSGSEEGAAPSRPVFKIRRGGLSSSLYSSLGRSRPAPSQASPSSTGRPVPSTGHNVNSGRLEASSSTHATVAQTSTSAIRTASGKPTGTEGLKLGNIDAQSISSDSEDSDIVNVMSDVRQLQKPPPPPPLPAQANGNGTPSRSFNPSYSYSLASAINDQKYRSWTGEYLNLAPNVSDLLKITCADP